MTLPAPAVVPPIVLFVAAVSICTPLKALPSPVSLLASVPIVFPSTTTPVTLAPEIQTPHSPLAEMMLPVSLVVPPIVTSEGKSPLTPQSPISTPLKAFPSGLVPSGATPIKFAWIDSLTDEMPRKVTPPWSFPETTLPAPDAPADVDDVVHVDAPEGVAEAGISRGVGADEVVLDRDSRGAGTDQVDTIIHVAGDDIRRAADRVVGGVILDDDPRGPVAQVGGTGGVGADKVPCHHVVEVPGVVMSTPAPVLAAIVLPARKPVPPIELPDAPPKIWTPSAVLPRLVVPAASVPIKFPSTTLPVVPEFSMSTPPAPLLTMVLAKEMLMVSEWIPSMTTGAPPMVLSVAPPKIVTPTSPLPRPGASEELVPIKFPPTLSGRSEPETSTPPQVLETIVLASAGWRPPIVLPTAPPKMSTPSNMLPEMVLAVTTLSLAPEMSTPPKPLAPLAEIVLPVIVFDEAPPNITAPESALPNPLSPRSRCRGNCPRPGCPAMRRLQVTPSKALDAMTFSEIVLPLAELDPDATEGIAQGRGRRWSRC